MTEKTPQENRFDVVTASLMDGLAQRVSRRGVLAHIGKFALGLAGLSIVPTLPLDRTFVVEAQSIGCDDWRLCGICGKLCADCCGGSGSLTTCPSCTTKGHFAWTKCCTNPACEERMIEYWDCCGDAEGSDDCEGMTCNNNCSPSITVWCRHPDTLEPLGTYRCTIIVDRGSC